MKIYKLFVCMYLYIGVGSWGKGVVAPPRYIFFNESRFECMCGSLLLPTPT